MINLKYEDVQDEDRILGKKEDFILSAHSTAGQPQLILVTSFE